MKGGGFWMPRFRRDFDRVADIGTRLTRKGDYGGAPVPSRTKGLLVQQLGAPAELPFA